MNELYLKTPDEEDERRVWAYRDAFFAAGEDQIPGSAGLGGASSYADWLERVRKNRSEETMMPGRVPQTTFLALRRGEDQVMGIISIRHRLNEHLLNYDGNIGYGMLPSERGKGLGTRMLALALEECRKLGLSRVLITCDKGNPASAKVMLHNGAVLENEVFEGECLIQRYWIEL